MKNIKLWWYISEIVLFLMYWLFFGNNWTLGFAGAALIFILKSLANRSLNKIKLDKE
jgi:hypothetical protein